MDDETASRRRRRRQHFLNATRPIGSPSQIVDELLQLRRQVTDAQATLAKERTIHRNITHFPWFFPVNKLRERIQLDGDRRLAAAEDRMIPDILYALHRAASIVQQLRATAAGVDANALLCSDLAEALALEALLNFRSRSSPESGQQSDVSGDIEFVVHALADVRVMRIDHSMDDLIENARDVARLAAALYADISVEQHKGRR